MEVNKLYSGQVIKNYKELCKLLNIKVKTGNSKKAQITELKRFCSFTKEGQKIIINEVYDIPLPENKNMGNTSKFKIYKNFNVNEESKDNIGVYKITLGNKIYIGSTAVSFRKRFQQHHQGYEKLMRHTYDMLQNGGKFDILHDMTGIEDIELIRMVEDEYIKEYLLLHQWEVINKELQAKVKRKKIKNKTIKIKIPNNKYDEVIKLLKDNNIEIIN